MKIQKNDPRLCIAGTEDLWSICRQNMDDAGISTEVLAENMDIETARLFAAAPELLEALREMTSMVEVMLPKAGPCQWGMIAVGNARAAIAKAERGEA